MPDHEKRARHMMLFERIKDFRGVAVLITAVKCQVEHLFTGLAHVVRAILRERLHGILAVRRLVDAVAVPQPPVGRARSGNRHAARKRSAEHPFQQRFHKNPLHFPFPQYTKPKAA